MSTVLPAVWAGALSVVSVVFVAADRAAFFAVGFGAVPAPGFEAAARLDAAVAFLLRVDLPAADREAAPPRGAGTVAAPAAAAGSGAGADCGGEVMPRACCMFTSRAWSCCSAASCCWSAVISALTRSCSLTLRSRSSVTWTLYCDASSVADCIVLSDMVWTLLGSRP
ncbi:hypothetical protein [Streptomyces ambofaciens]